MELQKINWKFFIKSSAKHLPEELFRVFNTWIPESPEIFIDVADYSHVRGGPLIHLCGFVNDYVLDETGYELGLLYNHKRPLHGSPVERLVETLTAAIKAKERLAADKSVPGGVSFDEGSILFMINDRALAPNTDATFTHVENILREALTKVLGNKKFTLARTGAADERFAVKITY